MYLSLESTQEICVWMPMIRLLFELVFMFILIRANLMMKIDMIKSFYKQPMQKNDSNDLCCNFIFN